MHCSADSWRAAPRDTGPRLRDIGLMDFAGAEEAAAEGRASVEQALPAQWCSI